MRAKSDGHGPNDATSWDFGPPLIIYERAKVEFMHIMDCVSGCSCASGPVQPSNVCLEKNQVSVCMRERMYPAIETVGLCRCTLAFRVDPAVN